MWKGVIWINMLYISGSTKQYKPVFQITMFKVLQDTNLNVKELTLTFTIMTIKNSWFVWVFFPAAVLVFFFCVASYFLFLTSQENKGIYLLYFSLCQAAHLPA